MRNAVIPVPDAPLTRSLPDAPGRCGGSRGAGVPPRTDLLAARTADGAGPGGADREIERAAR